MTTLFFSAVEGVVVVEELGAGGVVFGSAKTAVELAAILAKIRFSSSYKSSSVDFCEEEGFEAGAAGEMIDEAFALVETMGDFG